jgi:hypothetical protein
MATFQTQATDKNGKVLLGKLRSVSTQDGFDTALCTSALGLACLGGGGCDVCCTAIFCPCFLFGSNVKILRSGSYQSPCVDVTGCKRSAPCVKFLVPYTCIAMAGYTFLPIGPLAFCPLAMYTASYRHLIRKGAHSCVSQIQSVYSTLCDYTSFIQRKYFLLLVTFNSTRGSYKYITSALFPASGRLHYTQRYSNPALADSRLTLSFCFTRLRVRHHLIRPVRSRFFKRHLRALLLFLLRALPGAR